MGRLDDDNLSFDRGDSPIKRGSMTNRRDVIAEWQSKGELRRDNS